MDVFKFLFEFYLESFFLKLDRVVVVNWNSLNQWLKTIIFSVKENKYCGI